MSFLPLNPFLDIVLRTIAVYLFVVFAMRVFGKKELGQLSMIDFVFVLLISNSVQNAMVGSNSSLVGGITAAASLFILNYILKFFLFKNPLLNKFLEGNPVLLIHNGKAVQANLTKEKISLYELEMTVREHGVTSINEVDLAVLETDGTISILSNGYRQRSNKRKNNLKNSSNEI